MASSASPAPKTGIKVIIVGAGFGGLTAAIECHRHGHDVEIYEAFPALKTLGDIISFGANAGRIFWRWGSSPGAIAARLRPLSIDLSEYGFRIHKWDTGAVVFHQQAPASVPEAPVFNGHRGELHQVVFDYARDELGIPIHLGEHVAEYVEDDGGAGIVLQSGRRVVGDVVVGADGVRSKARELVLGYEDKPKSSGYAIWRAWSVSLSPPSVAVAIPPRKLTDNLAQVPQHRHDPRPTHARLLRPRRHLQRLDRARRALFVLDHQERRRLLLGADAQGRARH